MIRRQHAMLSVVPETPVAGEENPPAPGWRAGLEIGIDRQQQRTRLHHVRHWGPLRIQRPFFPNGDGGECHLYLLHPPGGMVTGDQLDISLELTGAAHGLLTTPSAGRIYRGNHSTLAQTQNVHCRVAGDSYLEWLPQETIVFDGARGVNQLRVDLDETSQCALWDIVCLGRPASGEAFAAGYLKQRIALYREGKPLYLESNVFNGGSPLLAAPWGLNGCTVSGTLLLTVVSQGGQIASTRELLQPLAADAAVGVSDLEGLLTVRYLGHSAEQCRRIFTAVWRHWRPALCGVEAVVPRIWNT